MSNRNKVLEAMRRCSGIDQTDQETGETFRFLLDQAQEGASAPCFIVVKLLPAGLDRVLEGKIGMTFVVDKFTPAVNQPGKENAHVRDYRYPDASNYRPDFQIWSLGPDDYEVLS